MRDKVNKVKTTESEDDEHDPLGETHDEKVTKRAVVAGTTQKCTKVSRVC